MQHAIDLMPQLRDILGMPGDLDLPRLCAVTLKADESTPGWRAAAQLGTMADSATWDALLQWAPGVQPDVSDVFPGMHMPSGTYRKVSVTVVVAEVTVEIWAHVDGDFVPPAAPVRVVGEFADLLIGGAS